MNYSSFQVSDWYHDLYVAHYLNGDDYASESSSADDHQDAESDAESDGESDDSREVL